MIETQEELTLLNGYGYKGNKRLRRAGINVDYTAEQFLEIAKCIEDPIYFCENYVKITTLDHGVVNFKPRPYQVKTINQLCGDRFSILKWPRQAGKCHFNSYIDLRNKKTGATMRMKIEDFFNLCQQQAQPTTPLKPELLNSVSNLVRWTR